MTTPEFSRSVRAEQIRRMTGDVHIAADADERAGMAEKAAEIGIRTGTENLIAMIDEALAAE